MGHYDDQYEREARMSAELAGVEIGQVGGDHYQSSIQPIDYIKANSLGFFEGNAIKYITRWRKKGGVEDLRKARHYIDMLIQQEV